MPLSPVCLVKDGGGPFVATTNGVDVTPANTISIKLNSTTSVVDWYLEVFGTDELSSVPALTDVNPATHKVLTPATVVTFAYPNSIGRAIGFKSTVTGVGGPIETTFGVYSITLSSVRVGFITETREGSADFGWLTKLNPLIRNVTAGGDLAGSYPDPEVAALHETSGPTQLVIGAIADGEYLQRVGGTVVGGSGKDLWAIIPINGSGANPITYAPDFFETVLIKPHAAGATYTPSVSITLPAPAAANEGKQIKLKFDFSEFDDELYTPNDVITFAVTTTGTVEWYATFTTPLVTGLSLLFESDGNSNYLLVGDV